MNSSSLEDKLLTVTLSHVLLDDMVARTGYQKVSDYSIGQTVCLLKIGYSSAPADIQIYEINASLARDFPTMRRKSECRNPRTTYYGRSHLK